MKCQELMRRFIKALNPDDTFSIIDFADTTKQLSPVPLANTSRNRKQAINYIKQLNAGGGTQLLRGIRAVLNFPEVELGRLRSIVLLTDGYIGNENQILAEVQRNLKLGNRLHSFGAGSSVNRFLLNRIAEIGRGISQIIRHDESTEQVAEQFFRQINNPVLTNIQLNWQGEGEPPVIYPAAPPDLFAEQPLVLFGRKSDRQEGILQVTGTVAGGNVYQQTFNLNFAETANPAIAQLWGRARIKDLTNQMVKVETKRGVEAVTDTALTYQLLSQYTAFVAVSDEVRVNPELGSVSVQVPVEMPEGVSYEGIFGDVAQRSAPMVSSTSADKFDITLCAPNMMEEELEESSTISYKSAKKPSPPPAAAPRFSSPSTPPSNRMRQRKRRSIPPQKSSDRLQLVSVTGLEQDVIVRLTQHLQSIQLPTGVGGNLVFEFHVSKGRVQQLVLDEQASSLPDETVIEAIRRSLLTWRPPQSAMGEVRIVIEIRP
ncbi:MAG: after-VIT domain-containing protein [Coleofasciculaceae cyanobacterium]